MCATVALPAYRPTVPLPEGDGDEEIRVNKARTPPEPPTADTVIGRLLIIDYRDASDSLSQRRIVPLEVFEAADRLYVAAHCLERADDRRFRVDRMLGVSCGLTGEDLGAPGRLFAPTRSTSARLRPDEGTMAVQYGLRVLATLAKADGHLHPAEAGVMRRFAREALGPERQRHAEHLADWGERQSPHRGIFQQSLTHLVAHHRSLLPALLEACGRLISADGDLDAAELAWMDELIDLFGRNGLEVVKDEP